VAALVRMMPKLVLAATALSVVLAGCTSPAANPGAATSPTLGQQMSAFYNDQPFGGGQKTPEHLFFAQPDGTFLFLHFDQEDPLKSNKLLWTGDAFPGKFCKGEAGVTQAEFDAGYVHFHKKDAANWDAGHGGGPSYAKTQDGFWFRHVSAVTATMQMMGHTMTLEEGKVFPMMPADQIPAC
jgi:hypothetical protein